MLQNLAFLCGFWGPNPSLCVRHKALYWWSHLPNPQSVCVPIYVCEGTYVCMYMQVPVEV